MSENLTTNDTAQTMKEVQLTRPSTFKGTEAVRTCTIQPIRVDTKTTPPVGADNSALLRLKLLLPLDEVCYALNHLVHERRLVLAHAIDIGDIANAVILRRRREAT